MFGFRRDTYIINYLLKLHLNPSNNYPTIDLEKQWVFKTTIIIIPAACSLTSRCEVDTD